MYIQLSNSPWSQFYNLPCAPVVIDSWFEKYCTTLNASQSDTVAAKGSGWFADSNVMMSPSAPSSMLLITVNVRTSFAFLSPPLLSCSPVFFLFSFSLSPSLSPPVSLPLSPGVSLSSPHKEQRQRIRASPDMTCRRRLWGAVGTHTPDRRREGSSAPTNETPDCSVKHTLCVCVCACPHSQNKKRKENEYRCRNNEYKNKKETQMISRCILHVPSKWRLWQGDRNDCETSHTSDRSCLYLIILSNYIL